MRPVQELVIEARGTEGEDTAVCMYIVSAGLHCEWHALSPNSMWQASYRLAWDVLNMSIYFNKCVLHCLNMMVFCVL